MRILIVENEAVVSRVWRRFLAEHYDVDVAAHAPEAITILEDTEINLAILDLRLNGPTPSGMEVYRYIRDQYKYNRRMPIIVVTGLEEGEELRTEAEEAIRQDEKNRIDALLMQKAIGVKELLERIAGFLTQNGA